MARIHLFEWMDQPWLPDVLRTGITDHLRTTEDVFAPYAPIEELLAEAIAASGQPRFVDLCSGGGGPAVQLAASLRARGEADGVVLTDLFPNNAAFEAASQAPGVDFHPEPVDATRVPPSLVGTRTLFNAFHHLPPPLARAVLADAASSRQPILVVETLSHTPQGVALALGIAALEPLLVFARRPPRLDHVLLSTLLPVLPLLLAWEGTVSALRCYSARELDALTGGLGGAGYTWRQGRSRSWIPLVELRWLLGRPV